MGGACHPACTLVFCHRLPARLPARVPQPPSPCPANPCPAPPRLTLQAKRQAQLEHLVGAKRLEDRVAGILRRVEKELDVAGGWWGGGWWVGGMPGGGLLVGGAREKGWEDALRLRKRMRTLLL